ncbi:hypothetical protein D9619_007516 [Psilocybe cf. subviscida]|uniref:NFX1-type zinc finger-containing protein 1 n=1 Tax=Psilocybe cf. subviscida TaxID=2480587 RepID=A0A8H5B2M0_9AGAR|nr:hypothetical protein D9619_007516 [Psilocybe cf. subviscida]
MSSPGVCRVYASGQNCRFGANCRFAHVQNGPGSPAQQTRSPNRGRGAFRGAAAQRGSASLRGGTPARPNDGVPPQTCRVFWQTGNCDRAFECQYRHTKNPNAAAGEAATSAVETHDQAPDFYSIQELATVAGTEATVAASLSNFNVSEVHNHIKPFLRDNYAFDSALKMQSFIRVLASMNEQNKEWTSNDAQSLLVTLVEGNGILRIVEILSFQPVLAINAGGQRALSFQQGFLPLLAFLTSGLLLKSTIQKNINRLYVTVEENYDEIQDTIRKSMKTLIERKSWKDPSSSSWSLDGATIFKTITTLLQQFFNRFKSAIRNHPEIVGMAQDLSAWFDIWVACVTTHSFEDAIADIDPRRRDLITDQLREDIHRLISIVEREFNQSIITKRASNRPTVSAAHRREAAIMRLTQTYDPPGTLRDKGPRHNNDFVSISDIRLAPTQEELLSADPPYLPINAAEAPHHLPEDSMERHLDIQFRLLREELISTLRASIQVLHNDIVSTWGSTRRQPSQLQTILKKNGGTYKTSGHDSVFFFVYTNVEFAPVQAERRDLTVSLWLDAPPGSACNKEAAKRVAYWKGSKRLQGGSLVALVTVAPGAVKIFLGVIASFGADIAESSKAFEDRIQVRISFFDPEVEFRALRREKLSKGDATYGLLVDSSVMFEASRPFLERIQSIEPQEVPFNRYIAPSGSLADVEVKPPRYATDPRFAYNLKCLAKNPSLTNNINNLDISRPNTLELARQQLAEFSTLDPSQVDAVLNTLTREVSLIQGPPGTGKSFTGRELLKVLFASKVKPIVLIAYTNHALDHMLTEVLDARITNKVIRLGSRSSDERIAEYTLDKLERAAERTALTRSMGRQFGVMKELEKDMRHVMEKIQLPKISAHAVAEYLEIHCPEHAVSLSNPPYWISELSRKLWAEEEQNGEWTQVAAKTKEPTEAKEYSRTLYGLWKSGEDLAFLTPPLPSPAPAPPSPKTESKLGPNVPELVADNVLENVDEVAKFFEGLGFGDTRPPIPTTDRPLSSLMDDQYIWRMSLNERIRVSAAWEAAMRSLAYDINLDRYNELREKYKEACKEYNDMKDETRRQLLTQVDLIACTTTGAAKLTSLISSIAPRVLMVEEAGQVLEAHILTSLVPSRDPQQLRPNLATFSLSMDSERGKTLFKFDRSLMERLADSVFPMTQLNVQRRMRPTISQFIRTILYPKLEDHAIVKAYPAVKGMQKDVFFMNHNNPEGGLEDSVSKYNSYEVEMIRDLVLYFLKQGKYSGPGDIAVLCAYLGQLQKVRAALKDMKIAVSLDARDEAELLKQGLEEEASFEEVNIVKHIRLGTVDIFQGQEAKIVIVSLVRNTGDFNSASASIGFLKSSNRINVALSRAKHGMYILGNAANLRRNPTWSTIIDNMEENGFIGQALPVVCARHPSEVRMVTRPKDLQRFAPEVCGEICQEQKCIVCLGDSEKQEIVDFLMQRRLHEIDLSSDDVSERLITLKCRHIFTVETLDGHCDMRSFYAVDDASGSYLGTRVPPIDYQSPPTCPTCRGPITSLRYGRVTKRATLDILEQNVASQMSRSLENLGPSMEEAAASVDSLKESAKKITQDTTGLSVINQAKRESGMAKASEPLPPVLLSLHAMNSIHGFSPSESRVWQTIVKPISKPYGIAHKIATTRSAHMHAYEGAYTTLYRLEFDSITNNPKILTNTPEELALAAVKKNIGQPPPKADSRFQVESIFYTIELRFMLAEVGRARIDSLSSSLTDPLGRQHKNTWRSFVGFLYDSCIIDGKKALDIAEKSSASKQAARCGVYVLKSEFERYRFAVLIKVKALQPQDPDNRVILGDDVASQSFSVRLERQRIQRVYVRSRPLRNTKDQAESRQWFEDNCNSKIARIIDEMQELENYVRKGGAYEPLSASEITDIVKAFNFSTTGHFYNCPNGHPFVITECGGAMQISTCPECGVEIGGGSHRLLDSNTTAPEFEAELRNRPGGITRGFY